MCRPIASFTTAWTNSRTSGTRHLNYLRWKSDCWRVPIWSLPAAIAYMKQSAVGIRTFITFHQASMSPISQRPAQQLPIRPIRDRKSVGKGTRGAVSVGLGGRRINKKKERHDHKYRKLTTTHT